MVKDLSLKVFFPFKGIWTSLRAGWISPGVEKRVATDVSGSCFFCSSASSLTFLEGLPQYLCSLNFSAPPQLFLMFHQLIPVLACLERFFSPDCAPTDSAPKSSKLPTCSCFHLLEPPASQSCRGDLQSGRFCLPLARNFLCLPNVSAGDTQHARIGLYHECTDVIYDFCTPGNLGDNSCQRCGV